jgi:hypothetical protein
MRNRRVYHILALMDESERRLFRTFLQSPLFQKKKRLLRFYDLWDQRVLGNETSGQETVEALLAGSDFSPGSFDKLCVQLRQKVLEFLSLRAYQAAPDLQLALTNQVLAERGAPESERSRELERRRKWLASQPDSASTLHTRLNFQWEMTVVKTSTRQTRAIWKENFQELHDLLDAYYYLQKLKLASATANARHMYQQEDDPAALFLEFFGQSIDLEQLSPLARAYAQTVQMLTREDPLPPFTVLSELLKEHGGDFEPEDAQELYQYALNFTIRKGNQGEQVYKASTGTLYRDLLEKGLLLINGCLPAQTLKNIVVIHCGLGELDWAEGFIEAYRDRLVPGTDPAVVIYNEAVIAYYRKDFGKAIPMLKDVVSKLKNDIFFELDARIYLSKAYFGHYDKLSLEEADEMERMYDAFRILIDRNKKLSAVHKEQYRNFIREFKRLLGLAQQAPLAADKLTVFRDEHLEMEPTFYQAWILEQANALLAKANTSF